MTSVTRLAVERSLAVCAAANDVPRKPFEINGDYSPYLHTNNDSVSSRGCYGLCQEGGVFFYWRSFIQLFLPSPRGGERRGLGQRPISPVRKPIRAKGRLVEWTWFRTFPLLWPWESNDFSPTAHSAIRGKPEQFRNRTLSRNLTIRVSRRGTSSSIWQSGFLPSLGPERAPFQSFIV